MSERRHFSRRDTVRLAGGGVLGLAGLAISARVGAQSATPEPGASPVGSRGAVTIYSGRNEGLVGSLIERFERATGIDAEVRYGDTAELAAQILEEGDNSPADVFFSQDAGALGALQGEAQLAALPQDLLDRVDPRFRSDDGFWIGASARARVLVYNTDQLTAAELPASVLDLVNPDWNGKVGWAPANASFQAFVTALRVLRGDDAARDWLEGMRSNGAVTFEGNGAIVRAVGAGEIPAGLVNHYYLYEIQAEDGPLPIANHFFPAGDPGALVNVAGAGILATSKNPANALAFVGYLLQPDAQAYFATETAEYPLIAGVSPLPELPPLAGIETPDIDLSDLADLQGTLALLTEVGII